MNRWWIGSVILSIAAMGAYLAIVEKQPQDTPPPSQQADSMQSVAAAPAILTASTVKTAHANAVVEVLDIEPLLDPPAIPRDVNHAPASAVLTVLGDRPQIPAHTSAAPATIPPAVE